MAPQRMLSVAQASERCGVGIWSAYRTIKTDSTYARVKFLSRITVPADAVEVWIVAGGGPS